MSTTTKVRRRDESLSILIVIPALKGQNVLHKTPGCVFSSGLIWLTLSGNIWFASYSFTPATTQPNDQNNKLKEPERSTELQTGVLILYETDNKLLNVTYSLHAAVGEPFYLQSVK